MTVKVKICGLTNAEDAAVAVEAGADAVGFVFHKKSPRCAETEVVKAIQKSELGITPQSDGKIIRLVIPPLSEDRRKQLSVMVRDKAEEARIAIRNVRRDANKQARTGFDEGGIPADDFDKLQEEIDGLTKQYEGKVDDAFAKKQKEIMEV